MRGLRKGLCAVALTAIALTLAATAGADDVTSAPTTVTVTIGGSGVAVNVTLTAADGDGQDGCNVDVANPAAVTFTAEGPVAVSGGPLSFQDCGTPQPVTISAPTGPTGVYSVTLQASGGLGGSYNVSPGSITVTVEAPPPPPDTAPPILSLPGNITAEATSASGAVVPFTATATDNVDGPVAVSCSRGSGSTFPIGITTVNCSAADSATPANTANGSFQVTVQDTQPPTVTVPAPIEVETNGASATVDFTSTATDTVDGSLTPTCSPASGATFASGTTTVACTASDTRGNQGSATFSVTVRDSGPPTLDLPSNITREATSAGGGVVSFGATATDNIDSRVSVSCSPSSGSTFPIGTTTVGCSATDSAGNKGTGSFQVTVQDTEGPAVMVPSSMIVGTGGSTAVVDFTATATDTVDGSLTPRCSPASGSAFAIGATTVTCTATDTRGNGGSATFSVTVRDSGPPTLDLPSNITREATSAGGGVVSFGATATDNIDSRVSVSCSPSSGSTFPIGTTTVGCSATDSAGNKATGSFRVTVEDTQPPTVTIPAPIEIGTNGTSATVDFTATASDAVSGSLTPTCSPASGSAFAIGATTVRCTASDARGNTGSDTFTVTVRDAAAPAVKTPANITADATSAAGRVVTFGASASDVVDGPRPVTCTPASGSTFRIGRTIVTCTARDAAGNTGSGSFTVTVTDAAPTIIVPPKQTVEATGPSGAKVTYIPAPAGSDTVDGPLTASCARPSGATFPLGTTTVTCTATDSAGASTTGSFQVNVVDTTPPVVTTPAAATFVAEGDSLSRSSSALAAYLARGRATDLVDPSPTLYVDAPLVFPLGPTVVTYTAVDGAGNRDSATTTITIVPPPPPGQRAPAPPPDDPPPGNVTALRATPGNALVRLSWSAPRDDDVVRYAAFRSERTGPVVQVYSGAARSFTDRGLVNGVEYRYVVVAYDRGRNRSVGVAALATPRLPMLLAPRDGARLGKGTTFSWRRIAGARYYNFQLFRIGAAGGRVKILSVWPVKNSFQLRSTWRFEGRSYRLTPGTYRWFVWPGFGPARYGDLLGERSFTITRQRG